MNFINKLIVCLLFTVSFFPLMSQANEPTLLILGDSLSAAHGIAVESSWVTLLGKQLEKSHPSIQIVNLSQSGATSEQGLNRLLAGLEKHRPKWLIIELGGNDGLRGLNINQTKKNLKNLIIMGQQAGAKVLLLGITLPPNYGDIYIKSFEKIYHELADEFEIPLVPFLLENIALNRRFMQIDRIHPTADAQPIILETVWKVMEKNKFLEE